MKLENYFTANEDLQFQFTHNTPWVELASLVESGFRDKNGPVDAEEATELYREALTLGGEYAGNEISGRAREIDEAGHWHGNGPIELSAPLRANLDGLIKLGMTGVSIPREYGGENFPFTASAMLLEILARADPSTMVQYAFYMSPALMILRFGSESVKQAYVPRLAGGEISGAVAMTEPQAGSDVGRVATTATEIDGGWRLNGRKQFITNGCGDFCIVLARSAAGSKGLEGLSLFLADRTIERDGKRVDNYVVERAENKVTIAGSATCGLSFDGTEAILLGELGQGWREILTFMNESRVAVGIQGLGTAQAAYEEASTYAAEREQMGRPIREHPLVADMLLDMKATIAGHRALAYEATVAYDRERGNIDLADAGSKRNLAYLRELTPLVKYFGAEEAIRVARLGLETFGGYGVIKDYDIERIFRDSLILPIYEGTSEIQALMSVKDIIRAVMKRPQSLIDGSFSPSLTRADTSGRLGKVFRKARSQYLWSLRYLLYDVVRRSDSGTMLEKGQSLMAGKIAMSDDDTAYILLHAKRLTNMLAHLHASRLLISQARRYPDRHQVAARMVANAAAVCDEASHRIRSGDRSTLEQIAAWHAGRTGGDYIRKSAPTTKAASTQPGREPVEVGPGVAR
jgi:3-(methylthio)propanoyl-CoA dehydrogenase